MVFSIGCGKGVENNTQDKIEKDNLKGILKGQQLTAQYCQNCHTHVNPDQLPNRIWKDEVLPKMGAYMGIYEKDSRASLMEDGSARRYIITNDVFPENPKLTVDEWNKIKEYYLDNAPDELEHFTQALKVRKVFQPIVPKTRLNPPMSTMVMYSEKSGLVYHGDVKRDYSTLNIFQSDGRIQQALALHSPPVKVRENDGALWVLLMGSFTSTDSPSGSLVRIVQSEGAKQYDGIESIIEGLQRPVDIAYADLDGDGDEDIVISQFGNWAGRLEWFEDLGNDEYKKHLLMDKTGATTVLAEDLDRDGDIDLLALFTQGEETIYAFINTGEGRFVHKKIIQLPPTHGSVHFTYVDIDKDGIKDIILSSGDNADYEPVLKPYHGIRIYLGKGELDFESPIFLPLNGAYKAIAADFDGDGDLDLAAISFFPDYSVSPKESIVMFENISTADSLVFRPFSLPGFDKGRWIDMDVGILDGNERPSLFLASFVVQDPFGNQSGIKEQWMANSPSLMILKNNWNDEY